MYKAIKIGYNRSIIKEEIILIYTVHQIRKDRKTEKEALDAVVMGEVDPVFFLSSYEKVCVIEAKDLDEVFEIGNIGPESKIERLWGRMRSISVGDVITTETHECYVVKPIGFERLAMSSPNGRQWTADEVAA
jgi:hypothetical protein